VPVWSLDLSFSLHWRPSAVMSAFKWCCCGDCRVNGLVARTPCCDGTCLRLLPCGLPESLSALLHPNLQRRRFVNILDRRHPLLPFGAGAGIRAGICDLFGHSGSLPRGSGGVHHPPLSSSRPPALALERSSTPRPRRARHRRPTRCPSSLGETAQGQTPPTSRSRPETMSQNWRGPKGPQR